MKKVIVISLGGSIIVPNKADVKFLKKFREVIKSNSRKYKFVIVFVGGSVARTYINSLESDGKSEYLQNLIGISVTRLNARFVSYLFGRDPENGIPHDMKSVKDLLNKNDVVFCGGLRYAPDQTSDATAARLANYLSSNFINITDVKGLYDKHPKFKSAKFIPEITISNLVKLSSKLEHKPGQHFVLDKAAIRIIQKNKIKTYIIGPNLVQLTNLLNEKKFIGTIIS